MGAKSRTDVLLAFAIIIAMLGALYLDSTDQDTIYVQPMPLADYETPVIKVIVDARVAPDSVIDQRMNDAAAKWVSENRSDLELGSPIDSMEYLDSQGNLTRCFETHYKTDPL